MVVVALFGILSLLVVVTGIAALYEQRLYTATQRAEAEGLFRLRGFLWLLTTGLGVVSFGLVGAGEVGTVIDFTFAFAFVGLVLTYTERQLRREIEADRSPLVQRFDDWWSHPSDR